jgi:hypothetical protein
MADLQIPIGGELVTIPEWAKESTLQSLVSVINSNDAARNIVIKAMNVTADDIKGLEQATSELKSVERESAYNQAQTIGDVARNIVGRATNIINQLGDTSKPLSSMTNMAKQMKDTVANANAKGGTAEKMLQKFKFINEEWAGRLVKGSGIATNALFAYGGFLSAKIEQFAEAQATMIDSGAIFMDSAQSFQHIREVSYQAGVSYGAMSKTINKYGRAVQSLGNGISKGSVVFAESFNTLNRANDAYGDFGQTSQEMMDTYAQYIDVMRLTGQTDTLLANGGAGLQTGYQQLMLENSSLAAATAFNRKQLIDSSFEAVSDADFAGPNQRIRESMGSQVADNIVALKSTFNLLGKLPAAEGGLGKIGPMMESMITRAQQNFETNGKFTFGTTKQDRDVIQAFNSVEGGAEFLQKLQDGIIDPSVQMTRKEILRGIANLEVQKGSIMRTDKNVGGLILDLNNGLTGFQNANKKLATMSDTEMAELEKKTGEQLKAQGGVTQAVNSAASLMLQAQEALTPNMVDMSRLIKNIADDLSSSTGEPETETEKRKKLEELIKSGTVAERIDAQAELESMDKAPVPVMPMPKSGHSKRNWIRQYGNSHNEDGSVKQRFIGGYLGSNEMALVGEEGPEMLITDMPSYVKTINQMARNLGDAIKSDVKDDGTRIDYYPDGYQLISDGGGTNFVDKDGNVLYNQSPTIQGYTRRTFSKGDYMEMYNTEAAGASVTVHMFNGKQIGQEIASGNVRVSSIGGALGGGDVGGSFVEASYNVGQGLSITAESMTTADGVTSRAVTAENENAGLTKPQDLTLGPDGEAPGEYMANMIQGEDGELPEVIRQFKTALKNMTFQQAKQTVRLSAEYE